jgi:hypothetical protein
MRKRATVTLVLIGLAVSAMLLGGCKMTPDLPEPADLPQETTAITVFYSTGRTLVEEPTVVDAADLYRGALTEMLKAQPTKNADIAIVQTTAAVLSAELDEATGLLTIDWGSEVLAFEAEPAEKRLAYAAIMMTVGQFPEVKQVQFTVNGQAGGEIGGLDVEKFWGDVSLMDQPWDVIRPPSYVDPSAESSETTAAQ